jgi:hypothetical protein
VLVHIILIYTLQHISVVYYSILLEYVSVLPAIAMYMLMCVSRYATLVLLQRTVMYTASPALVLLVVRNTLQQRP